MLHELLRLEVELAHGLGVFASRGESNQAIPVSRIQADQAFLHPFLVVLFPQSVVVQHGVPVWLRRQVVSERGPAQNTLHVLRILPGVVNLTLAELWRWQPVRR